jgi:pyruvate kinase
MKKTKIVCTIGPATADQKTLEKLMKSGMNVARINMSHGDQSTHAKTIKNIRAAEHMTGCPVGILIDLSGPKIRTGNFITESITLISGKKVIITTSVLNGTAEKFTVLYKKLPDEVVPGSIIMINDGKIKLLVEKIIKGEIHCKVIIGGTIKGKRGVNIINGKLSIKSITEKDRLDITWALKQDIDFIALSFVRNKNDILNLRKIFEKNKFTNIPSIIAKIETAEAIENISEIINIADGVMIARGDLSVEIPRELVPIYQKQIITQARSAGKYSIVATQMMESMIHNPSPTRAEISDVANAIFDGTDAVMLSEETSLGEYPVETVTAMRDIALSVEDIFPKKLPVEYDISFRISHAIAHSAERLAHKLSARMIIALTESGRTAREIAQFHGNQSIIAITPSINTTRSLSIIRGVTSHIEKLDNPIIELRKKIISIAKKYGGKKKDIIVIASGHKMNKSGSTNTLMVEEL